MRALPNWLMLLTQTIFLADSRACAKTGISIDARMPIIAITTRSSISVNALRADRRIRSSFARRRYLPRRQNGHSEQIDGSIGSRPKIVLFVSLSQLDYTGERTLRQEHT